MEVWALMRAAFSAARVALSRAGINKIATHAFAGVCRCAACMHACMHTSPYVCVCGPSSILRLEHFREPTPDTLLPFCLPAFLPARSADALGARHALALACSAAAGGSARVYINQVWIAAGSHTQTASRFPPDRLLTAQPAFRCFVHQLMC
eukprot:350902-Chlamydomonas_euryale.AAC.1